MALTSSEIDNLLQRIGFAALPPGTIAQTYNDRRYSQAAFTPTSGTLYLYSIILAQSETITSITHYSSGAQATGTHLWYALYDQNLNLLGQTADQTGAAAFPSNTALPLALTSPYVTTYGGLYYIGFCCSAGTTPTLVAITALTQITGIPPIISASSTTALAGVAPNPAGALTSINRVIYSTVS